MTGRPYNGFLVLLLLVTISSSAKAEDWLVFSQWHDGQADIYLVQRDGTRLTRLTDSPGNDTQPAWSADGSRIAFVSDREGVRDIWVMRRDGSQVERMTDVRSAPGATAFHHPSWSPATAPFDDRLIFLADGDKRATRSVWINGPGFGQQLDVELLGEGWRSLPPTWSLGGDIQFPAIIEDPAPGIGRGGLVEWGFGDVSGSIDVPLPMVNLSYAADGRFAFDSDGDIWVGRNPLEALNMTNTSDFIEENPDWSHDRRAIAYESDGWIWTSAPDGTGQTPVVEGQDPAWSPFFQRTSVSGSSWGDLKKAHGPKDDSRMGR